ncbi:odorant binding protein [Anopheles darlingi]|uniref:Odorant binding protein n=1 Tax=Anopheles darlingi TaxID=43151 RepID=W5JL24_ANODA|nr:general odorant-binding protein 56d-like [Anopheles darlingi]ETN64831.1 odorant binding protein [Anopheles darlingi]
MKFSGTQLIATLGLLLISVSYVKAARLEADQIRRIHQNARECVKETGVLPKNAFRVLSGDFSIDTIKAKCFVKCFFDKAGFIGEDGKIQQDVIRQKLAGGIEPAKVNELIKKCNVEGDDVCDTAYQMYKCFFSNHKIPKEMFQLRKGIGRRNMQQ